MSKGQEGEAIEVVLNPRDYRRRAVWLIAVGSVLLVASAIDVYLRDRLGSPVVALYALGYGIYCARQARKQVSATLLRIDSTGIHAGEASDRSWAGVIMVWVGSQTGFRWPFVVQPVLSVFTHSGVTFARRAGIRPSPLYTVPIGGRHQVSDLCSRIGALTTAEIVDGTAVSRRAAADALREQDRTA